MKNNIQQKDRKEILTVILGIILGILVFIIIFFLMSVYENVTHQTEQGVIPEDIRADFLIPVILGSLISGFFSATKSSRRTLIYSAITGVALIILWMISQVGPYNPVSVKISAWLILPSVIIGGWLGSVYKRRKGLN